VLYFRRVYETVHGYRIPLLRRGIQVKQWPKGFSYKRGNKRKVEYILTLFFKRLNSIETIYRFLFRMCMV
jgi:hypothetical protein